MEFGLIFIMRQTVDFFVLFIIILYTMDFGLIFNIILQTVDFGLIFILISNTVEPLYYGHQGDMDKCPHYRGVRFREVGFIWISVSQGPSELSVIERCP